ncbi:nucleotide exchange factor GrpE [Roseococcus thiosulfatophilus]|uniref:nucleotide exchange factor GrpE n=1 Tax=Roseococcus thiosulfatophilus TaxID=35813 RepID=UPI001A8F168A|nr:nucleotide exchange factor GrpE [Roseococcus thiosulfatophilus]
MTTEPNAKPDTAPEDETVAATEAPPAPEPTPEERIAALEAALAEMKDRWLRAEAEIQNVRNRARDDVEKARNFAVQKFAADVVEAAENLRRGLDALPAASEDEPDIITKLRGGFEGVERFLLQRMEANGVARKPAQGEKFNPDLHQAMSEAPAPEGVEPGTILQAWSSAWTLNGRLLKPAMVVVAGQPAAAEPQQ